MGTRLMPYLDGGSLASISERFGQGSAHLHDTVLFLLGWETRAYNAMIRNLPERMSEPERERAAAALKRSVRETREAMAEAMHKMQGLATIAELVVENAAKAAPGTRDVRSGA